MWRLVLAFAALAGCSPQRHDALLFIASTAQEVRAGELVVSVEQAHTCATGGLAQVVVTRAGVELFRDVLTQPCATLSMPLDLAADPVVGVTVDTSAGFGSWSGPTTRLLLLSPARPRWLEAVDSRGVAERVELLSSLKSVWAVTAPVTGHGDVLQARTRMDERGAFTIARRRIHCERSCIVHERVEAGFREWDTHDFFPELAKFPH